MNADVHEYVMQSLREMNYDVTEVTDDTVIGPEGLGLESLAAGELALRAEGRFEVKFGYEWMDKVVEMTVGEFCEEVARQVAELAQGSPAA